MLFYFLFYMLLLYVHLCYTARNKKREQEGKAECYVAHCHLFFFKAVNKGRLYIYTQILWHV